MGNKYKRKSYEVSLLEYIKAVEYLAKSQKETIKDERYLHEYEVSNYIRASKIS